MAHPSSTIHDHDAFCPESKYVNVQPSCQPDGKRLVVSAPAYQAVVKGSIPDFSGKVRFRALIEPGDILSDRKAR